MTSIAIAFRKPPFGKMSYELRPQHTFINQSTWKVNKINSCLAKDLEDAFPEISPFRQNQKQPLLHHILHMHDIHSQAGIQRQTAGNHLKAFPHAASLGLPILQPAGIFGLLQGN